MILTSANGANGMSDMAGYAARVAVERSGSCRDTNNEDVRLAQNEIMSFLIPQDLKSQISAVA